MNRGPKSPIGLAISGGVDSMALASLSARFAGENDWSPELFGFIVDHKMRPESTEEALHVADELAKININPRILTLDWTSAGDPSKLDHIESAARRLRYQALGRACRDLSIRSLLVAHHIDDVAETVLIRLIHSFYGSGLRGILSERQIPECEGFYGVHESGRPCAHGESHMQTEAGGVRLLRPLLALQKAELLNYCREVGVSWFEDPTNRDPTLTTRNTVRFLQKRELLPVALRTPRLLMLAKRATEAEATAETLATEMFRKVPIRLDLSTGRATCKIRSSGLLENSLSTKEVNSVETCLVKKLLRLVSPNLELTQNSVHGARNFIFYRSSSNNTYDTNVNTHQAARVQITRTGYQHGYNEYVIGRSLPERFQKATLQLSLTASGDINSTFKHLQSDWHLWDGRYWVRIAGPSKAPTIEIAGSVRFLTAKALAELRKSLTRPEASNLNKFLDIASGKYRFTLPAIFIMQSGAEELVALPSLGWSRQGWIRWPTAQQNNAEAPKENWWWDIRYKHIDMHNSPYHKVFTRSLPR